ncbi:MAG: HD domain-containing protein [Bacteroidota bacterium]
MKENRLIKQLAFIQEVDKLKYIVRKTRLFDSARHENDAEHSWHLAMMALVLAEHSNGEIDMLRVLKMLLIHDIVEIDAGDTFLFDSVKDHENTDEELVAAERIFGLLPEEQRNEFISIWQEFEAGETADAKFAKSLDRFEPVLQNLSNGGGTWAEFKVSYEKVVHKISPIKAGSQVLWDYTEEAIEKALDCGTLLKKEDMFVETDRINGVNKD